MKMKFGPALPDREPSSRSTTPYKNESGGSKRLPAVSPAAGKDDLAAKRGGTPELPQLLPLRHPTLAAESSSLVEQWHKLARTTLDSDNTTLNTTLGDDSWRPRHITSETPLRLAPISPSPDPSSTFAVSPELLALSKHTSELRAQLDAPMELPASLTKPIIPSRLLEQQSRRFMDELGFLEIVNEESEERETVEESEDQEWMKITEFIHKISVRLAMVHMRTRDTVAKEGIARSALLQEEMDARNLIHWQRAQSEGRKELTFETVEQRSRGNLMYAERSMRYIIESKAGGRNFFAREIQRYWRGCKGRRAASQRKQAVQEERELKRRAKVESEFKGKMQSLEDSEGAYRADIASDSEERLRTILDTYTTGLAELQGLMQQRLSLIVQIRQTKERIEARKIFQEEAKKRAIELEALKTRAAIRSKEVEAFEHTQLEIKQQREVEAEQERIWKAEKARIQKVWEDDLTRKKVQLELLGKRALSEEAQRERKRKEWAKKRFEQEQFRNDMTQKSKAELTLLRSETIEATYRPLRLALEKQEEDVRVSLMTEWKSSLKIFAPMVYHSYQILLVIKALENNVYVESERRRDVISQELKAREVIDFQFQAMTYSYTLVDKHQVTVQLVQQEAVARSRLEADEESNFHIFRTRHKRLRIAIDNYQPPKENFAPSQIPYFANIKGSKPSSARMEWTPPLKTSSPSGEDVSPKNISGIVKNNKVEDYMVKLMRTFTSNTSEETTRDQSWSNILGEGYQELPKEPYAIKELPVQNTFSSPSKPAEMRDYGLHDPGLKSDQYRKMEFAHEGTSEGEAEEAIRPLDEVVAANYQVHTQSHPIQKEEAVMSSRPTSALSIGAINIEERREERRGDVEDRREEAEERREEAEERREENPTAKLWGDASQSMPSSYRSTQSREKAEEEFMTNAKMAYRARSNGPTPTSNQRPQGFLSTSGVHSPGLAPTPTSLQGPQPTPSSAYVATRSPTSWPSSIGSPAVDALRMLNTEEDLARKQIQRAHQQEVIHFHSLLRSDTVAMLESSMTLDADDAIITGLEREYEARMIRMGRLQERMRRDIASAEKVWAEQDFKAFL